ncbi:class A beta-lactamase-related serine hydrolase [Candidatus Bathyarchaeota archaeon]|nr:class A beta-lactamase-related serine hydrolase [Candidatus Bathyarchaeota archaeon]
MSILHDKTQAILENLAFEADGVVGFHAFDPDNPEDEFDVFADEVFPTASIIKVPILLEFYRQAADGVLDLGEVRPLRDDVKVGGSGVLQFLSDKTQLTLEDWAKLMINLSDNTATNYMIDVVGMDNVNRVIEQLGLVDTRLRRKMQAKGIDPDKVENLTTPREFSTLLMMIMNHEGLDSGVCEKTLGALKLYKDGIIRDALPGDFEVADKSGWMGAVQCDSGIVYAEKPYIVTVMAKHIPAWDRNGAETRDMMKQAVAGIHDYYQNIATASRYGRRIK